MEGGMIAATTIFPPGCCCRKKLCLCKGCVRPVNSRWAEREEGKFEEMRSYVFFLPRGVICRLFDET